MKSVAVELRLFVFAAFGAALGLVNQAFFFVEFLFALGEHKFLIAVFAYQGFVAEHV